PPFPCRGRTIHTAEPWPVLADRPIQEPSLRQKASLLFSAHETRSLLFLLPNPFVVWDAPLLDFEGVTALGGLTRFDPAGKCLCSLHPTRLSHVPSMNSELETVAFAEDSISILQVRWGGVQPSPPRS